MDLFSYLLGKKAGTKQPTIATEITSNSTNDEVAGAKAVYDFAQVEDITSQVSFTPNNDVTVVDFKAYKSEVSVSIVMTCRYPLNNAGVISLGTFNLSPIFTCYGSGTGYNSNDNKVTFTGARITTDGTLSVITTASTTQAGFGINFPISSD